MLAKLRRQYHRELCAQVLGARAGERLIYNIADSSSPPSIAVSEAMVKAIDLPTCRTSSAGQTAGSLFTVLTKGFLEQAFTKLQHIRPGEWEFGTTSTAIARFEQYTHLSELDVVLKTHKELAAALGGDYLVAPDIVVYRQPLDDGTINADEELVGADVATYSPLRKGNPKSGPILHASVSCKWTMRSDRAQNTRTEALNLIRNRKGGTPRIVAVTMEPLPTRLASIAMGTGDIDCTYHGALHELSYAVREVASEESRELLESLIAGRRLRDISDLPLDLAI